MPTYNLYGWRNFCKTEKCHAFDHMSTENVLWLQDNIEQTENCSIGRLQRGLVCTSIVLSVKNKNFMEYP